MYVISMARILSIVSSHGYFVNDFGVFRRLRVPVLDRNWLEKGLLSVRGELSDVLAWVQFAVPCWGAIVAFFERGL